ncbi:hypothetical protein ACVCII_24095 [Burkholderia glumae]|uniref:hypothetical protein n=1 Tax=Burkholderia glumae TaxID=337 RepID=UPI00203766BC|nr:hypothetical protein [Burkholderia glumae]MCM2543891.1 hypothetical protein [Burkholderia glumae]
MDLQQTTDLGIAYHIALDEMIHGRGTEEHWSTVACALNITLVLAERVKKGVPGWIELTNRALAGVVRSRDRARRVGAWGFDGEALADVKEALVLHDEQMAIFNKGEIMAALAEVHRRIDAGEVLKEAA